VLNDPINIVDPDGLKGGILIPIRKFFKNNIGGGDIIAPIIENSLSIPTSAAGILLFDFLNPKEAGVGDEKFLMYQWEKKNYPNDSNFNIKTTSIVDTLSTPTHDVVIKSEPCK